MSYNLPKNYFMGWLREKIDANLIKIDFKHSPREKKYVSDFITKKDIESWDNSTPVFISAQTGAGKTHFIKNILINYLHKKNELEQAQGKILYLGNRTVLNRQLKIELAKLLIDATGDTTHKRQHDKELTPIGIDKKHDYGIIEIRSYQDLGDLDEDYSYIICDECHFFTSDSGFNENTSPILKNIINKGNRAIRIYISATPEVAFEAIVRKEYETQNPGYIDRININRGNGIVHEPLDILYYDMTRNYEYLKVMTQVNREKMIDLLKNDDDEDSQWLIFVSSPKEGKESYIYQLKGEDKNNPKAVLLTADNKTKGKSNDEFQSVADDEEFKCKYLVCTSVLDNGVSIKPNNIKGVIVDGFFDRVEIMQMVGRIRKPTSLDLYIILPNIKTLYTNKLTSLISILSWDLMDCKTKKDLNMIKASIHQIIGPNIKIGSFYLNDSNKFYEYNDCSIYYLINELLFLKRFIKSEIEYTDNIRGQIKKLYDYYMYEEGRNKPWSRNIVDLLEPNDGHKERQAEWQELIDNGTALYKDNPLFYTYETGDSFLNYIYFNLIGSYYDEMIISNMEQIFTQKQYEILSNRVAAANDTERLFTTILREAKKLAAENKISFDSKYEDEYLSENNRYSKLGDDSNFQTIKEEIYRWFELPVPPPEDQASDSLDSAALDVTEDYFMKYVLDKHYEKVKKTTPESKINPDINMITDPDTGKKVRFEASYIKKHGLWKRERMQDGSESDYSKFLKLKGLEDLQAGDIVTLNGKEYKVDEQDAGDSQYKTAYFLIPPK